MVVGFETTCTHRFAHHKIAISATQLVHHQHATSLKSNVHLLWHIIRFIFHFHLIFSCRFRAYSLLGFCVWHCTPCSSIVSSKQYSSASGRVSASLLEHTRCHLFVSLCFPSRYASGAECATVFANCQNTKSKFTSAVSRLHPACTINID